MHRIELRAMTLALTLASTAALVACSSSKSSSGSHSSTSAGVPVSSSANSSSPPSSSSASGTPADAQTTAAVKKAYETALNYKTPPAAVVPLLQDGAEFEPALQALAAQAQTTKLSVTVSSVALQSPNTAIATFTIYTNGSAVVKDTPGYAVREGGTWKLAGITFCGLVSQTGTPPPACMTAKATTLPS